MTPSPTVLVAGHVTHDRYDKDILPGGCAYYAAQCYRSLGATTLLKTAVGSDFVCDSALDGIEASILRQGTTTLFTNSYPSGEIRVQRIEASAPPVSAADLPTAWRSPDLLHLAPVMGEIDLEHWLNADINVRYKTIGIQGWIKRAGPEQKVVQTPWQPDPALLRKIDAACVGEEDLMNQGDLLQRLCDCIPVVAFTHGQAGCEVIVRGKTSRIGIYPTQEIDPTGAGDSFAAGFFWGLTNNLEPTEAARLGAAVASIVVEGRAGITLNRVSEALERSGKIEIS